MFALLKRADPHCTPGEVGTLLDEVSSAWKACAPLPTRPFRFRASFSPEEITFNHEIAVDLVYLEGRPVLTWSTRALDFKARRYYGRKVRTMHARPLWSAG